MYRSGCDNKPVAALLCFCMCIKLGHFINPLSCAQWSMDQGEGILCQS